MSQTGGGAGGHRKMMIVTFKTQGLQTLKHIGAFLEGNQPLDFETPQREDVYDFTG